MRISTALDWLNGSESPTPFEILGVVRTSSNEEIKRAYRKLMMQNHPDLGGDLKQSQAINEAYKIIKRKRGI